MANIYSDPEKFGLKIVAQDECGDGYDFDTLVLFEDLKDGRLYLLWDLGCSCPVPFEGKGNGDLVDATLETVLTWEKEYSKRSAANVRRALRQPPLTLSVSPKMCCTPDHHVLTKDGRWVEAQDLKPEDKLKTLYRQGAVQASEPPKKDKAALRVIGQLTDDNLRTLLEFAGVAPLSDRDGMIRQLVIVLRK